METLKLLEVVPAQVDLSAGGIAIHELREHSLRRIHLAIGRPLSPQSHAPRNIYWDLVELGKLCLV
jgi:hypothetical protein